MNKHLKNPFFSGLLMTSLVCSGVVHAQTATSTSAQAASMNWESMTLVGFNAGSIELPQVSRVDMDLARNAWSKEIKSTPISDFDNKGRLPSFILLSTFMAENSQLTFSIFSAAMAKGCTPPGNGRGIEDVYSVCPLRVTQYIKGNSHTQEYQNYCHIFPEDNKKGDINQAQMAFDPKHMTAYFRVIQHGKHVKECDRKLIIK